MDDQTKQKAYAMRLSGMSWTAIAERLHYNRSHLFREMTSSTHANTKPKRRRRS